MTQDLTVTEFEHDVTRVFSLDGEKAEISKFYGDETRDAAVAAALGVEDLDPKYVDVVRIKDLGEIGLTGFLGDGHGVEDSLMADDAERLDGLTGTALIVGSAAFKGKAARIEPGPELTHIATYRVDPKDASVEALPHGQTSGPDVQREAEEHGDDADPVERSTISWVVIASVVVAAILVVLVAF